MKWIKRNCRFPHASEEKLCDGSSTVDTEMKDPVT